MGVHRFRKAWRHLESHTYLTRSSRSKSRHDAGVVREEVLRPIVTHKAGVADRNLSGLVLERAMVTDACRSRWRLNPDRFDEAAAASQPPPIDFHPNKL
jgi:hypothetical protein